MLVWFVMAESQQELQSHFLRDRETEQQRAMRAFKEVFGAGLISATTFGGRGALEWSSLMRDLFPDQRSNPSCSSKRDHQS